MPRSRSREVEAHVLPPRTPAGARGEEPRRVNLLGMPRRDLRAFFVDLGERPYRADQIMKWVYRAGVVDFDAMTDISRAFRARLARTAEIRAPDLCPGDLSGDGVVKWLARTDGGQAVETVLIPDGPAHAAREGARARNTLCISTQVGCALDCSFCATGKQGFSGNLDRAQIVGQAWQAARLLAGRGDRHGVTNIVFMGMGEPLLNFDAVVDACDVFTDHLAFGISKRRVTVSTAGVVPRIYDLADRTDVSLAVSLHAARDDLRYVLVPLNRRYPIGELLAACRHYLRAGTERRTVTFEYTLIEGVNDTVADARDLVRLVADVRCKINLIPYNPLPASVPRGPWTAYRRPAGERIARFQRVLLDAGVAALRRTTRGDEIAAACGQLTGTVRDRTRRSERYVARSREVTAT